MPSPILTESGPAAAPAWSAMSVQHPERLPAGNRLRAAREHAAVKADGAALRGRFSVLLVLVRPGEPTRVGFVASRRGVGPAVDRNRARRRLREIVRRRWPRIVQQGFWMDFVARAEALTARHEELATDVEHLLAAAGALRPLPGWEG
jgi:ribonuclease P protein component